jgi:two-component system, OmpR family, sensor histidine kinase KdpD
VKDREENYSTPDEVLARIKADESRRRQGKLKIFLGYAAGVGKTYAMLEAAREIRGERSIVAAVVETHGRQETEALLKGFEVISRLDYVHRGVRISEMDLDAVLKRHPDVALVDELAHTNASDARHPKRYQDVEELLDCGIDVYTTLNIQHIESLRNTVAQATGVWVRETVPDRLIDRADEIEVIDLPPDELLKRLAEGKIYVPEQAALATEQFFRKGNLLALRELALRVAAERVDKQAQEYKEARGATRAAAEHVMLCLGAGFVSDHLVRNARRLAAQLDADWVAVFVETPGSLRLLPAQREKLDHALQLVGKLGGRVETIQSDDVAPAVAEYARLHQITKIVVGSPQSRRGARLFSQSTVNRIVRQAGDTGVYIVGGPSEPVQRAGGLAGYTVGGARGYLFGLLLVAGATLIGLALRSSLEPTNIVMLYLLAVVTTASLWGLGPSVMVSIASVLAFDYFLVVPYHTFRIKDTQYFFTFLGLLIVGLLLSYATARLRWQTQAVRRREQDISRLYSLSRRLAVTGGRNEIIKVVLHSISETFGYDSALLLPGGGLNGRLKDYSAGKDFPLGENEMAAGSWTFEHAKTSGSGTDTLPSVQARFIPLVTSRATVGVLALKMGESASLVREQQRLLEAFADLAALAVERIQLSEDARRVEVLKESERLQTALLNSISHDLRTPLVSVIGTLSSLQEEGGAVDEKTKNDLIKVAREEADRLNHLISNLLDESRLEAGAVTLSRQPLEIRDLVAGALEQLGSRASSRPVNFDIPEEIPFITVDFGLIVQALANVLDNAIKYSPDGSPVEVKARGQNGDVVIEIADHGIGIPERDLQKIFDKFYRIKRPDNVPGSGLGLAISKGIIEAHGGSIKAMRGPNGGTTIQIILPAGRGNEGVIRG